MPRRACNAFAPAFSSSPETSGCLGPRLPPIVEPCRRDIVVTNPAPWRYRRCSRVTGRSGLPSCVELGLRGCVVKDVAADGDAGGDCGWSERRRRWSVAEKLRRHSRPGRVYLTSRSVATVSRSDLPVARGAAGRAARRVGTDIVNGATVESGRRGPRSAWRRSRLVSAQPPTHLSAEVAGPPQ